MDAEESRTTLLKHLKRALSGWRMEDVAYACDGFPRPENGLIAQGTAVTLTVAGRFRLLSARDGEVCEDRIDISTGVFALPQSWRCKRQRGPLTLFGLLFHPDYTRYVLARDKGTQPLDIVDWHSPRRIDETGHHLLKALEGMARENRRGSEAAGVLRALVAVACDEIAHPQGATKGKAWQTWLSVKDYLNENFHLPINRESVARSFKLNPSYLSRLFTAQGDESFNAYLTRLRMEQATLLLREGAPNVAEVARRCGYEDAACFSRLFRKLHGVPPTGYRR